MLNSQISAAMHTSLHASLMFLHPTFSPQQTKVKYSHPMSFMPPSTKVPQAQFLPHLSRSHLWRKLCQLLFSPKHWAKPPTLHDHQQALGPWQLLLWWYDLSSQIVLTDQYWFNLQTKHNLSKSGLTIHIQQNFNSQAIDKQPITSNRNPTPETFGIAMTSIVKGKAKKVSKNMATHNNASKNAGQGMKVNKCKHVEDDNKNVLGPVSAQILTPYLDHTLLSCDTVQRLQNSIPVVCVLLTLSRMSSYMNHLLTACPGKGKEKGKDIFCPRSSSLSSHICSQEV